MLHQPGGALNTPQPLLGCIQLVDSKDVVAAWCVLRRSAGKKQEFEGEEYTIEELTENRWAAGQQHRGVLGPGVAAAPAVNKQLCVSSYQANTDRRLLGAPAAVGS